MPGVRRVLRMYGQPSENPPLDWEWVQAQLEAAPGMGPLAR
jgi:hypothetical protein